MTDATPKQRRAGAEIALLAYRDDAGERPATGGEEWIGDLVTDLLHLATYRRYNVERILRCARRDYAAEGGDGRLDGPYSVHLDAHVVGKVREQHYRAFTWHNARTLGDVVALTKRELLATPGLSELAFHALVGGLDRLGLELDPD